MVLIAWASTVRVGGQRRDTRGSSASRIERRDRIPCQTALLGCCDSFGTWAHKRDVKDHLCPGRAKKEDAGRGGGRHAEKKRALTLPLQITGKGEAEMEDGEFIESILVPLPNLFEWLNGQFPSFSFVTSAQRVTSFFPLAFKKC